MTPKDFAKLCQKTEELHELSWDQVKNKYKADYTDCAERACEELGYDRAWAKIVSVLIFPGYSDVWDWCDEVLK